MRYASLPMAALPLLMATGCMDHLGSERTEIIDLEPASGAANVAPEAEIAIAFSAPVDETRMVRPLQSTAGWR